MDRKTRRVLFLNSRSEYGGADTALLAIVQHLSPQLSAWVILPEEGPLVDDLRRAGAQVYFMPLARLQQLDGLLEAVCFPWRSLVSAWRLWRFVRQNDISLVYTNSSAVQVGAVAARLAGIPHIWHIREIWTSPRAITVPLYRFVEAFSDQVIAVSRAVAEQDFGQRAGRVKVIHDGISPDRYRTPPSPTDLIREFALPDNALVLGAVGRIVPQKGFHCFLQAAEIVARQRDDVYFMIVGDIPRPRYQEYKDALMATASRPPLANRVIFAGWRGDVPSLLHNFALFVLPSIGPEGLGTVIAEAWLAGRPVIAPDHSGPKEMVRHGETGLLFRSGVAEDLAAQMMRLLQDDEFREDLAVAGQQEALTHYSAARNANRIEATILEILSRR